MESDGIVLSWQRSGEEDHDRIGIGQPDNARRKKWEAGR